MTLSATLLAGLAAIATAAPALAGPTETLSVPVSYADLDLSTDAGAVALQRRVSSAARSICRVGRERDLGAVMQANKCYRAALETANRQIAAIDRNPGESVALANR